ncbi:hypothetical protein PLICBS_007257 [Purpureocillium lilacinum]|uniref:uncharacterized protein n=1 Tax=Purpureocillium lilacinum TaxID=33203 RepID=UPI002089FC85|nr:hypothetical protein PLICBS_007257 [Purpureocillium lilacinum]
MVPLLHISFVLTGEKQQQGMYRYECEANDTTIAPEIPAAEPAQLLMRWAAGYCHEKHGHNITVAAQCINTYDICLEPVKGEDQSDEGFEKKAIEALNKCLKGTG